MLRILIQLVRLSDLDNVSQIHDRDPIRDMANNTEIMGDEEVSQLEFILQVL